MLLRNGPKRNRTSQPDLKTPSREEWAIFRTLTTGGGRDGGGCCGRRGRWVACGARIGEEYFSLQPVFS